MILSLLRECHNNKDRIGVIHAALQNVVQLASWDVSDLSCLLTTVVDIALPSPSPSSSSSSSLDVELSLLALRLINSLVSESYSVLESHHLFHHITQILDRMAYLFEHLSSHTEPKEVAIQCSHFLGSMLQLDDEATQSKIEKLFPKFVSLGLKYLESASNEFLGIYILQTCLSSKYFGTISNSTIAPLRVQCLQLLESAYLQADVAKLLAISLQQGTTELWLAHWKAFTDECFNCLVMLGIIDGPLLVTEPTIDLQAVKLRIGKLAGWSKAQLVSSLHAGLLYVLTHLLEVGNCNGYMAINIGSYISYNTSLLSYTINMSSSSSTYLIANKQHITPASLRLLLPTMKIQCLQLLSLLLRTFNGGLARYGSSLCKLIATALALHKDTDLPVLLAALDTFSLAMALFPSLILQVCCIDLLLLFTFPLISSSLHAEMYFPLFFIFI